ncbi:MAG: DUF362 domain-containing protein [Deltaproteobacteria bacterium]|nr:DUF362 domain-containing protein [Deltaproteobacteria bacterium]
MVSIRKKGSRTYRDLVLSVVEDLGLAARFQSAKKILIKPNLVASKTSSEGVTVDLNLIGALVEVINETSEAGIVVGETALMNTEEVFRNLNVYGLEEFGCSVENFEKGEWVQVEAPFALLFKRLLIPKTACESDLIINVSKMKTHELTGVTLGLKNFFGLLSSGGRRYAHTHDINKGIVDIYSYFGRKRNVVSIIDGLTALSGRSGPIFGTPVDMDCLVSSADTVQGDAAAALIMGALPSRIGHIRLASEVMEVDIKGMERASGVQKVDFNLPLLPEERPFRINAWLHGRFYKHPVQKDSRLCTSCRRCEGICPENIVRIEDGAFHYNPAGCAHCLCCVEACNTGAISSKMKNEYLFLTMRHGWKAIKALRG